MKTAVERRTVDLSQYPDLVVIYLGMRVNRLAGLKTLLGFGPRIQDAVGRRPDGLLLHEDLLYSLVPPHAGMRQYWRDFEFLERWARSEPHRQWWQRFVRDFGGTGFWHETYFMRGGMEAIYDDVPAPWAWPDSRRGCRRGGRCSGRGAGWACRAKPICPRRCRRTPSPPAADRRRDRCSHAR